MTPDNINVLEVVQGAVKEHGAKAEELIPILNDVNRAIGYLPKEALEEIGRLVKTPKSKLNSVASFYSMMSTKPRGRHVIQFCESAPCHVAGLRNSRRAALARASPKLKLGSSSGCWASAELSPAVPAGPIV